MVETGCSVLTMTGELSFGILLDRQIERNKGSDINPLGAQRQLQPYICWTARH